MKVKLDKTFPLPCSPEIAWELLQNLEAVAACMPGAKLTERVDRSHYKGTVTVKVGPATMSFRGGLEVHDVDPPARSLRIVGKGTDSGGSSGASMDLQARIDPAGEGSSALVGSSEVSVSGRAASFGGRMMDAVADQVLQQFAANFAADGAALQAERSTSSGTGPPTAGATQPNFAAGRTVASRGRELNAFTLAWVMLRDWWRGLFAKRAP